MEELWNKPPSLIRAFIDRSGGKGGGPPSQVQCHRKTCERAQEFSHHIRAGGAIIYLNEFGTCSIVPVDVNVFQLKAFFSAQYTVCSEMQNHSWLFYHLTSADLSVALSRWIPSSRKKKNWPETVLPLARQYIERQVPILAWLIRKQKNNAPTVDFTPLYFYRGTSSYLFRVCVLVRGCMRGTLSAIDWTVVSQAISLGNSSTRHRVSQHYSRGCCDAPSNSPPPAPVTAYDGQTPDKLTHF